SWNGSVTRSTRRSTPWAPPTPMCFPYRRWRRPSPGPARAPSWLPPWQESSALLLWQPMADRGSLGPSLSRATLSAIVAVGVGLAVLTAAASLSALRSQGRPFPGLFTDPHGSFSEVWWPAWGTERVPLRFPDRLVAIDGVPVPAPRATLALPAQPIAARMAALAAARRS